jgi:hypothetical protein
VHHESVRPLLKMKTYQTPADFLRTVFWVGLRVLVLCYVSWGLSVYSLKFWENPRASTLIAPAIMALVLVSTIRLTLPYKGQWWPIVPALAALIAPLALRVFQQTM